MDDQYKKVLIDVISVHELSMRKRLMADTTAISNTVLQDFDWKLQVRHYERKFSSSYCKKMCFFKHAYYGLYFYRNALIYDLYV